jgi:hypothetical protein
MVEITTGGLTNQSQALVSIIECNDGNASSPFSEVWLKINPPNTGTEVFIYECFDNQTSNLLTQDNTSITWTTTAPSDQVKEWLFVQGATNINGAVYAYKSGNTTMVGNATFAGDVTISKNQGQLTLYGGGSNEYYSKIYCGSGGYLTLDATQGTRSIYLNYGSSCQFAHNGTEQMRLHDSGALVLGSSIVATDPGTDGIFQNSSNIRTGGSSSHGNSSSPGLTNASATQGIYWNSDGSGGWGGGGFTTSNSDVNMKQNMVSMDIDALNIIDGLNPIYFNWREGVNRGDTSIRHASISAQAVKEVFPEGVYGEEWDDDDEDINGYSFDQQAMITLLVKSVKELSAKVEALEAQVSGSS